MVRIVHAELEVFELGHPYPIDAFHVAHTGFVNEEDLQIFEEDVPNIEIPAGQGMDFENLAIPFVDVGKDLRHLFFWENMILISWLCT